MGERLQVILELVTGQYKREAREAASATGQIGKAAQGVTGPVQGLSGTIGKLGGVMAGVFAGTQIVGFAKDSIMAASDLEESINAVNVVFGEAGAAIHEFGETSVDSVGLAAVNVNKSATVLGSALINVGLSADEAAAKTIELTTRAADMASVFNTSVPTALEAIQAALRGETDPIEKFGVTLTAAAVNAEAAALGYKKVAGEFDSTAKAAARMSLIMKGTERVAGDFENTADSTANTMKRLNERFTETKARVGQALMPAFTALLGVVEDLAPAIEDFALQIGGLVGEMQPLIDGLGHLTSGWFDLRGEIRESADSADVFHRTFGGLADIFTRSGLETLTELFRAFEPEVRSSGTATRVAGDAYSYMAGAARDGLGPALEDLTGPLEDVRTAQQKAADAALAHRDALIALTNRLIAQLNPAVAAYQALQDLEEAQKAAKEAADEFGASSEEAAAAQLDLAVKTAAAQAALNSFGNVEGAILALAGTLGITRDAAAEVLINLGLITAKDWETTVILNVRTQGDLSALERGVIPEGMGIKVGTTTTNGSGPRAFGGPVSAYKSYLVGERGPEMFVSGTNGSIIPNDVLKSMSRPNTTIVVQSPMDNFRQDLQYATVMSSLVNLVEAF